MTDDISRTDDGDSESFELSRIVSGITITCQLNRDSTAPDASFSVDDANE